MSTAVPVDVLRVVETFTSIQGEGPAAGRAASFIRLAGCNLSCSWCDTPESWDPARGLAPYLVDPVELADQARAPLAVITGGEPLLQQQRPAFAQLVGYLEARGREVHLETNGTIPPVPTTAARVSLAVVSPKLPNAGPHRGRQRPDLHPSWANLARGGRAVLKVVCRDAGDVAAAVQLADTARWPAGAVWVMPEGRTVGELAVTWPVVAEAAVAAGINVSHRLHVLAWGAERGR